MSADYLKDLFAQQNPENMFAVKRNTIKPALAASSIPDMLLQLNLGFLANYFMQGDNSRIFHKNGSGTHFFYNYECPDNLSKAAEIALGDEDDDFLELEDGEIDTAEKLSLDLTTDSVSVNLDIVFNEDTALYQLDAIYIKPSNDEFVTVISCEADNIDTIHRLTTELCPMIMKVVNGQYLDIGDLAALWPFYTTAAKPASGPAGNKGLTGP